MERWFHAELDQVQMPSDELRILRFSVPDGAARHFVPGQFIKLEMNDGEAFQRSYSIASMCEDASFADGLEIAISPVEEGRATAHLFHMKPGDPVDVYGPYGQLVIPEEPPRRLWFVSTGTGVAPYRAMVPRFRKLLDAGTEIYFLLGMRNEQGLLYRELWQELADAYPQFHCYLCYSRQMPEYITPLDHSGRVQAVLETLPLDPENDLFFLCGNPAMIDDVFAYLKEQGFATRAVRREKYVHALRR